ncbi:BglG family transcription antiterminator [Thermovenabulum sp.]|uniref:BglG family transcription antiterminator n=1 Tax=Thermovenabulum sp. TaxID=3100335 RepID=UPI003C79F20A
MLDERSAKILSKLLREDDFVKIETLSREFNVSIRTVQYDLDKIDYFLKNNGLSVLERRPKKGIRLLQEEKQRLNEVLKNKIKFYYYPTPKERQDKILGELFKAKGFITIEAISNLLGVSRSTVIKDLLKVAQWLYKNNLKLITLPRYGVKIEGEERAIRKAALLFLRENLDSELPFLEEIESNNLLINKDPIIKLLDGVDFNLIINAVKKAEEKFNINLTDKTFNAVVLHIAFAIKRIMSGKDISMPQDELLKLKKYGEYEIAKDIVERLQEDCKIKIPEDEVGYITIHLVGGNFVKEDFSSYKDNLFLVQIIAARLIELVGKELKLDFSRDKELFNNLIQHLGPAFYRLKNGIPIVNPILSEIKEKFREIFEACKRSVKEIENISEFSISEDEVGYIAIHFGASIERMKFFKQRLFKVYVVCGTGIGTAEFLTLRLKKEFKNLDILGTASCHNIKEVVSGRPVDLIISTVPLAVEGVPVVCVSPILSEKDIENIKEVLSGIEKKVNSSLDELKLIETIIEAVERYAKIMDKEGLYRELYKILYKDEAVITKGDGQPVLKELLTKDTIRLKVKAESWEEAVRIGGRLLFENGYVESTYVEAMVKNVKEIGPYIVIAPGIAMPHARPEDGVKSICMSLITLENPVEFGNKDNDPVRMVICFGAVDHENHLKALSELMEILMDKECLDGILKAESVNEVLNIIKNKKNRGSIDSPLLDLPAPLPS